MNSAWEILAAEDIAGVDEIAAIIHPGLPERREVFAEKRRLFPDGCMKLVDATGKMVGYGLTHPWVLRSIPLLDDFIGALPTTPACLYIHDVALLPEARGRKALAFYVEKIKEIAYRSGFSSLACVSVYGTDSLWERYGFRTKPCAALADKLATYGETAKYMVANV